MAREAHDYDDIPGTFVFDAERSRQGYGINMFCMSLMKEDNRKAFKADEAEYLKKFKLTPEQTEKMLKGGRSVEGNRSKSGKSKSIKAAKSKSKSRSKSRSKRG